MLNSIITLKTKVRIIISQAPPHKRGKCGEITCSSRSTVIVVPEDESGNLQDHNAFGLCNEHWNGAQQSGQIITTMNMPTMHVAHSEDGAEA